MTLGELAARMAFTRYFPQYEKVRQLLQGRPSGIFQKCIGQPYLFYVPAPNHWEAGAIQHNEEGFRGPAVPMRRVPGVSRVLCLGGSTTYGWGVFGPDQPWPARLQRILESDLPRDVHGVEVINGGLPWGTTAELLNHYHFKFHYFHPDLVILNVGGNDAGAMTPNYQPDYSHWRQDLSIPRALPRHSRWLMRSRLASLFVIYFMYDIDIDSASIIRPDPFAPAPTRWYSKDRWTSPEDASTVPKDELAFDHNLRSLIEEIRRDGAKMLLVPFRAAPNNPAYSETFQRLIDGHESLMKDFAAEYKLPMAPFPASIISPQNWVDECHLNADGENEKANHIAPYARNTLWP